MKNKFHSGQSDRQYERPRKHWAWGTAWCYAPFLRPVCCIQSVILTVKDRSAVTRWQFSVFCVFVGKAACKI